MSFYSRLGGASPAMFAAKDAWTAAASAERAAAAAGSAAEMAFDAAAARLAAAKALHAQLEKMDADWFKRVASSSDNTGSDWAMYQKYIPGFPIDPRIQSGPMWDFDSPNDQLFEDTQKAWAEHQAAEDALPAARAAKNQTFATWTQAKAALAAAVKKLEAQSMADQAADAAAVTATSRASTQAKLSAAGASPLVLVAVAVPVVGAIIYAMTRKKSSVAGYRRRSRR